MPDASAMVNVSDTSDNNQSIVIDNQEGIKGNKFLSNDKKREIDVDQLDSSSQQ